jgi:hypothetical protein
VNIRDQYSWLQYYYQRMRQNYRFRSLNPPPDGWPILLGISFPKSGTNLLRQVLLAFAQIAPYADRSFDVFAAFDAKSGKPRNQEDALQFLNKLRGGDIAAVHFHTWPEVVAQVLTRKYIPFFIYRDPRDVVVSHVFYVTTMAPEHVHHKHYAEELTSFDDRLTTSILGRPEIDVDFPDIRKRYEPYLGWVDLPQVLPLRYEDFILDRQDTLNRVSMHYSKWLDIPVSQEKMLTYFDRCIAPEKSPTFRSGKVGGWKTHFQEKHKELFKQVSGDLLIQLGYESDSNW